MNIIRIRLEIFIILLTVVLIGGTAGIMFLEKLPLVNAFYFVISTVSTVGYGDISPTSALSKLFAVAIIIIGTSAFVGVFATAVDLILHNREKEMHMEKLHMVVGAFFGQLGNKLLATLVQADP